MLNHYNETTMGECQHSVHSLQQLLDFSLDVICSFDALGRFMSVTAAVKTVLGYEPCELIGKKYSELVHPQDYEKTTAAVATIVGSTQLTNFENRYIRKDGTVIHLLWSAGWDKGKEIIYCVARDATQLVEERKKAETYKQRLFRAYHLVKIAWWEWNAADDSNFVSDELYEIYGLDKEDYPVLSTELYLSMVHPNDLEKVKKAMALGRQQEYSTYDHRVIKPSGEIIHVIHYVQSIKDKEGHVIQVHGTTKDITERKKAELELKNSKRTLKTILDSISDGFFAVDRNWRVTFWNPKAEALLLKKRGDILGKNFWEAYQEAVPLKFYSEYHRAFKESTPVHFEEYFQPLNLWLEVSAYPSKETLAVYFRDITDRKLQETNLKESNQRFEHITKATFDAIWDYDMLSKTLFCNDGFNTMFGFGSRQFSSEIEFWKANIHPEDFQRVMAFYQQLITSHETSWFQEFRFLKKNGEYAFVQDKGVVIRDENNNAIRLIGALRDVSETNYLQRLEDLEKEILTLNARGTHSLQDVLDKYTEGIAALHPGTSCTILQKKGNYLYPLSSSQLPTDCLTGMEGIEIGDNKGFCGTAAYWKHKVIVEDIANDERWAAFKKIALPYGLKSCWSNPILDDEGNVMAVFAVYRKEEKSPSEQEENTIERASRLLKIILENDQKEKALQESNLRYSLVTKATNDAIWDWDLKTGLYYIGEGFTTIFGHQVKKQEPDIHSWIDFIHPDDQERVIKGFYRSIDGRDLLWKDEYRFLKAGGPYAYVVDKAHIIRDENGKAIRVVGAMQDITKQKEAELSIQRSEHRFKQLFEQNPIPKWMFNEGTLQIIEVNNAALGLYGYSKEEFLQLTILDLIYPSDREQQAKFHKQPFATGKNVFRHIKKNGQEFYIEISMHEIMLPSGRHFVVSGEDMTEKLQLQQRLIEEKVKAQKRIGQAVLNAQEKERSEMGRELHDNVNQILTSVKLYQELVLSGTGNAETLIKKSISLLLEAINANRSLSKQLSAPTLGNIKLKESVLELVETVTATHQFDVNLECMLHN